MRSQRRQKKIEAAKSALQVVLGQLPSDAQVGILLLNGKTGSGSWVVPVGPVNLEVARAALKQVRAGGETPLGARLKQAADALLEKRAKQHYGEYRLLVVTDGEATDGPRVARFLPEILARGLTVDVIGVDMRADHSLATQVRSYRRADDPDSLQRAVQAVFAESSSDQDDRQTDFEFLSGFPSDVAAAALAALAEAGNEPIGSTLVNRPMAQDTNHDSSASPAAAPPPMSRSTPATAPGDSEPRGTSPARAWIMYAVMLVVFFLALSAKRRKRNR